MKKTLCFYVIIFLASFNFLISSPVDIETIKEAAVNVYDEYGENSLNFENPEDIIHEIIPLNNGTDTLAYIINYYGNSGFAIFAADDRSVPLLCFSFRHNYDGNIENPAFYDWLKFSKTQLIDIIEKDYPENKPAKEMWKSILKPSKNDKNELLSNVSPLLSTTWNQSCYYNMYCPEDDDGPCDRALVGCVAVSMAQAMKYYNYPSTGQSSHTYTHNDYGTLWADFSSTSYEWSNMPNRLTGNNTSYHQYVAKLLYHCGVSVNMNYGPGWSSASVYRARSSMINYFKYPSNLDIVHKNNYSRDEWEEILRDELDEGRPMIYVGYDGNSGHAFNCDGYKNTNYFHYNWGWGGAYDGYFYVNDLSPGSYDFTSNQYIVRYIDPDGPSIRLNNFSSGNYCAGNSVSVEFTVEYPFSAGNVFTLELSDEDGSFLDDDNITDLGMLTGTSSGTITGEIPDDITQSDKYKIRITASNPEQISVTNNAVLNIRNPVVSHTSVPEICVDESHYQLAGGTPSGGIYTGDFIRDQVYFNAQDAGAGDHTVHYVYEDSYNCKDSVQVTITVNPLPDVTLDNTDPYCVDDEPVDLGIGHPSGGVYSGNGIIDPDGRFNPAVADTGKHTITYTYQDINGCENSAETTITVKPLPAVTMDEPDIMCVDENPVILHIGNPAGGEYSGNGITDPGGRFDPAEADVGDHTITYTYSDQFGCKNTAQTVISVKPLPQITLTEHDPVCIDAGPVELEAIPAGGTFSGPAVNDDGVFHPDLAGAGSHEIIYSYSDEFGCGNIAEQAIVVNALPEITLEADAPVCINEEHLQISATPEGGFFEGDFVNENGIFDHTASGAGSFIVNYVYTDENGCTSQSEIEIVVQDVPEITFEFEENICLNNGSVELTAEPEGGIFEGNGIEYENHFNPEKAGVGDHIVNYTYTAENGCTNNKEISITVAPVPEVTLEAPGPLCACGDAVDLEAIPENGRFEGNSVSENGEFDPGESGPGLHDISYIFEAENGCADTAKITIDVKPAPDKPEIKVENYSIICSGGGYASYLWYLNDEPLSSETNSSIVPQESGHYKLEAGNEYGCKLMSDELLFQYTDVPDVSTGSVKLKIIPNPAGNKAQIRMAVEESQTADVYFTGVTGIKHHLVKNANLNKGVNTFPLSIDDLNRGFYIVSVILDGKLHRIKFIKID